MLSTIHNVGRHVIWKRRPRRPSLAGDPSATESFGSSTPPVGLRSRPGKPGAGCESPKTEVRAGGGQSHRLVAATAKVSCSDGWSAWLATVSGTPYSPVINNTEDAPATHRGSVRGHGSEVTRRRGPPCALRSGRCSERGGGSGRPWLAPPGLDRSGSGSRRKHSGAPATPMGTHVAGLAGPSMASSLGPDRRLVRCPPTYISVGGVFTWEDFPASRAKTLGAERDVTAPALCQQRRPRDAPRVERPGAVAALRSSKGQRDTFPRTALHRERSALV